MKPKPRRLPFDTGREVKATNQQIIDAYRETGTVWLAAKRLGMAGQSVWERLRVLEYPMFGRNWTDEELDELRRLAGTCTLGEIGTRLGRPYAGVAGKLSELGLVYRYGKRKQRARRQLKYPKSRILKLIDALENHRGSIKSFCRQESLDLETFVSGIQRWDRSFWEDYTRRVSDLTTKDCPYCGNSFYPLNGKQRTCSRRCSDLVRRDRDYFGGKRRNTIGLAEGICQLCMTAKDTLSAHHMLGKQNDPDNDHLIALCSGCHHIVGALAGRLFVDSCQGWENLVNLVLARRLADKNRQGESNYCATHTCVDIEWLTPEDLESLGEVERAAS